MSQKKVNFGRLRAVMKVYLCKFGLTPIEYENTGNQSRPSFHSHLRDFLHDLHVGVLEHRSHNFLLEGRQVLGHLAIDVIVLLPQLFYVNECIKYK